MRVGLSRRTHVDRPLLDEVTIADGLTRAGGDQSVVATVLTGRDGPEGPTVVVMHGACGAPEDLTPFAFALALCRARVCNVSWRAIRARADLRTGTGDVVAAVSWAEDRWQQPVTLVAWSDGAFVAARLGLDPAERRTAPAAVVGLAGYYGWDSPAPPASVVNERTVAWIGARPETAPAVWQAANPYAHIGTGSTTVFHLVVARHDPVRGDAQRFQELMAVGGHQVSLTVVDDAAPLEILIPRLSYGRQALDAILQTARSVTA
jgi:pimeloyl-ACP methyl ester carboxylesterase